MKPMKKLFLPMALVLSLGACANSEYGQKQTAGAVLGGAAGGLLGNQVGSGTGRVAATAAGAVLGLFVGSEIGKSMDKADRAYAEDSYYKALETSKTGSSSEWRNPDSGNYGSVTPTRTYQTAAGQPCREYQQTVVIDGRSETAYGTACRQADGSWKVVN